MVALKPDPVRHCRYCNALMKRKRFKKRLEDMRAFTHRHYCNRSCMAKGMMKQVYRSRSYSRSKSTLTMKPTCEACGSAGKRHVHHIDGNPLNNALSNLKTLCASCHARCHSPNYTEDGMRRVSCDYCAKPSMKRGLCYTHMSRFKRFGHPLAKKKKTGSHWLLMLHDGNLWFPFRSAKENGIE